MEEKFYRDAIEEYAKRLGAAIASWKSSRSQMKRRRTAQVPRKKCRSGEKEGERVLARLEKCRQSSSYVMALAIDGRELDSVEALTETLEKLGTDGISHVIFLIGGSLGMSKELLAAAEFELSFSRMTLPRQADAR